MLLVVRFFRINSGFCIQFQEWNEMEKSIYRRGQLWALYFIFKMVLLSSLQLKNNLHNCAKKEKREKNWHGIIKCGRNIASIIFVVFLVKQCNSEEDIVFTLKPSIFVVKTAGLAVKIWWKHHKRKWKHIHWRCDHACAYAV